MLTALLLLAQRPTDPPKPTRLPGASIGRPIVALPRVGWMPTISNYTPAQPEWDPKQAGNGVNAGVLKPEVKKLPYALVASSKWKSALQTQGLTVSPGPGKGWDFKRVQAAGQAAGADYIGMIVLAGAKYGSNPHQSWISLEGVLQVMDVKTGKIVGDPLLVSGSDTNSPHDSSVKYSATVFKAGQQLGASSAPSALKTTLDKLK